MISLLTVIGTAIVLLWLEWRLGLFILLVNPIVIYFSRMLGSQVKHLKKRENADKYAWQSEAAGRLSFLLFLLGFELFRAVAMLMVVFSDLTIGQIFAVFGYLWFMLSPVQELLGIQFSWYAAKAALKRINSLLELEEEYRPISKVNPLLSWEKSILRSTISISPTMVKAKS